MDNKPKTIAELKEWYLSRGLPPEEVTRFFIGKNYIRPKAFGIYEDERGNFVVYKNKADGSRAIRYAGKDEARAVGELYERLKEEILHQKTTSLSKEELDQIKAESAKHFEKVKRSNERFGRVMSVILIAFTVFLFGRGYYRDLVDEQKNKYNGYYSYNNDTYYRYGNDWFIYTPEEDEWDERRNDPHSIYNQWNAIPDKDVPDRIKTDGNDYFEGSKWSSELNSSNFKDSDTYKEIKEREKSYSSYDNDSSYNWNDNDSWDSDSTDWDSDW